MTGPHVPPHVRSDVVTSVAISADSATIVSGSDDETVRVWSTASGDLLHTLTGHTDHVTGVAMSADGRTLVSASKDRTVRVWDAVPGAARHTLEGHTDFVNGVAVTRDGTTAVSASRDRTMRLWNVVTGTLLNTLTVVPPPPPPVYMCCSRSDPWHRPTTLLYRSRPKTYCTPFAPLPGLSLRRHFLFLLRTALKDSPQGPSTANRQPPTATNRQPPTATNRQSPTFEVEKVPGP